jgi:hypothetical protein
MSNIGVIDFIGKDEQNRTLVLIVVANLGHVSKENEDRIMLYIMKQMETFRCRPFVLVMSYSGVDEQASPDVELVHSIFDLLSARYMTPLRGFCVLSLYLYRYQENMQQFYILHASYMIRMYLWVSIPCLSNP